MGGGSIGERKPVGWYTSPEISKTSSRLGFGREQRLLIFKPVSFMSTCWSLVYQDWNEETKLAEIERLLKLSHDANDSLLKNEIANMKKHSFGLLVNIFLIVIHFLIL